MITLGELCAGAGGVAAGLCGLVQPIVAVEIDPAIAEVHAVNHPDVQLLVEDVATVNLARLGDRPDWLHASPSCKQASAANRLGGGETVEDRVVASAICRAIRVLRPRWFSLENVRGYEHFKHCFPQIVQTLWSCGYDVNWWVLCAADYDIPQTRDRLWLLASRENRVQRPQPTHRRGGDFMHAPWPSWFDMLTARNLIDTLPESEFAPWQLDRLEKLPYLFDCLVGSGNTERRGTSVPRRLDQPCFTIPASGGAGRWRAFLVHPTDQRTMPVRGSDDPSFTVMAGAGAAARGPTWKPRAFVMRGDNADGLTVREDEQPSHTITAAGDQAPIRAFVVDDQHNNGRSGLTIREAAEPIFTISATQSKRSLRALLECGRTVALTPEAGAALQTFPADFVLPDSNQLAWQVVGNAVPPAWMPHIARALGLPIAATSDAAVGRLATVGDETRWRWSCTASASEEGLCYGI